MREPTDSGAIERQLHDLAERRRPLDPAYSHVIIAVAMALAVAPDHYTQLHLVGDVTGLLDALGEEQAVVVGHDWGAPVAWHTALFRPDCVRGVVVLSVPYTPRGPASCSPPYGRRSARAAPWPTSSSLGGRGGAGA